MAHLAVLFNFLVKYVKIIIYSTLQDNSSPFSLPHLAISVLATFKPEVGHMTTKVGVATNNVKVYNIF